MSGAALSRILKSATSATDDVAAEMHIINSLTTGLSEKIKKLQIENIHSEEEIRSYETSDAICYHLEAIFLHGIKDSLSDRINSMFSSDVEKLMRPHFWKILTLFSHKDVICQIEHLTQINSDVGRCRAWLRMALNDGLLDCYISTIRKDRKTLKTFYKPSAYLLDSEHPHVLLSLIQSLGIFSFKLAYNSRLLNKWLPIPLILCGLWIPAMTHDPVMPGVDADAYFNSESEKKGNCKRNSKHTGDKNQSSLEDLSADELLVNARPRALAFTAADFSDEAEVTTSDEFSQINSIEHSLENIDNNVKKNKTQECTDSWLDMNSDIYEAHDCEQASTGTSPSVGNSLSMKTGWSSPFDNPLSSISYPRPINPSHDGYGESYDTVLYSYRDGRKQAIVIGTPSSSDLLFLSEPVAYSSSPASSRDESDMGNRINVAKQSSPDSIDCPSFEIIPSNCSVTSKYADERTRHLVSIIPRIINEKGLLAQRYECAGCHRPIGMIYGKSSLCLYDSMHYCTDCHINENSVIPARVIHNWDFQKYPVCKFTKLFLNRIEDEPLIDLRKSNRDLYTIVDELQEIQALRTQLSYLKTYLFGCQECIFEEFRKRIWPKEYLYEHIHLFSLSDLLNVANGNLAQFLQKIVMFASKHVHVCRLCSAKGFICEICSSPKVIYPFELSKTYRCEICRAVFHASCMDKSKPCPKCLRRQQRKIASEDFSVINCDDEGH